MTGTPPLASSVPSSPPKYRLASLKGYLPVSEESSLSTRGQVLPGLLQSLNTPRRPSQFRTATSYASLVSLGDREREREQIQGRGLGGRAASVRWGSVGMRGGEEDDDIGDNGRRSFDSERGALMMGEGLDVSPPQIRKMSSGMGLLLTPQMRSQRLIGNSNPRYKWEQYWKTEEELKAMKKPIRKYYERNNGLIQQYIYIDRLLDSSLPHHLIQEYGHPHTTSNVNIPPTITELPPSGPSSPQIGSDDMMSPGEASNGGTTPTAKVKRTPKNLYKLPDDESTPLLKGNEADPESGTPAMPDWTPEEDADSQAPIVRIAIYINLVANTVLLILKIIVMVLTSSVSVLASLVDAALDFLSTAIVWTTTKLISVRDAYKYPVGRRRLEPIGVLVFSVIMITSFFQVALEGFNRLTSGEHLVVQLGIPAIAIMATTVIVKFLCWLWCRVIKNSSVQALAQDAMTDVVFNIFSIIFPLVGYYANLWWLDSLGGVLLSFYVIFNWSRTTTTHIRNLTGAAASADERNVLLYLTMRFAKTIRAIQGLQAYHAGDKLNIEVDVVLDEGTSLRDSHDLGESLQYVLESVPTVDRAFVHLDYGMWNLPSHMEQQGE